MNPKVTIIVPVFNTVKYLLKCIKSIEKINFDSYEVLFIDNCSTDGSYEILKKIKSKKFKIYKNKKNFGQSYSLNKGINLARSPYIAIMDSDDICLKNRIKDSYNFLKNNPNYSLVAGTSNLIDENDRLTKIRRFTHDINLIKCRIFLDNPISHTTVMFRKNIIKQIGGYSQNLKFTQDFDLIFRLINNNKNIKILEKSFTLVRKHKKQQSYQFSKKQNLERYKIVRENIANKIKIDSNLFNLVKFFVLRKDSNFENLTVKDQILILDRFLNSIFKKDIFKLYFCTLIFSQPNNFRIRLKLYFITKYVFINKFLIFEKEIIFRLGKSLFKIFF